MYIKCLEQNSLIKKPLKLLCVFSGYSCLSRLFLTSLGSHLWFRYLKNNFEYRTFTGVVIKTQREPVDENPYAVYLEFLEA